MKKGEEGRGAREGRRRRGGKVREEKSGCK